MSNALFLPALCRPARSMPPMMADDELAELAADIKANGLRQPLVLAKVDAELILIDGRRRRADCGLAGIEAGEIPSHMLDGQDPLAYVHSSDLRRDITKSQRVMAYAVRFPEAEQLKRGSPKTGNTSEPESISTQRLAEARTIIANSIDGDLVRDVLSGAARLGPTLDKAKKRAAEQTTDAAKLAELRKRYVDLADLVADESRATTPFSRLEFLVTRITAVVYARRMGIARPRTIAPRNTAPANPDRRLTRGVAGGALSTIGAMRRRAAGSNAGGSMATRGKTAAEFDADLKRFADAIEGGIGAARRAMALSLFAAVTRRSPVGNSKRWKKPPPAGAPAYVGGRLKASWFMSDGAPRDDAQTAGQSSYPSEGDSTATFAKAFDRTWLVNNVPYAQMIEFGHSTVAPQGVARLAILDVEREFGGVKPLPNMPGN